MHWLRCPRFAHLKNEIPNWLADNVELPACTLNHLLVPRQQCLVRMRDTFCKLADDGIRFWVSPPHNGFHDLFLDGSCFQAKYPQLNLAAWGGVDATSGTAVAAAPLSGVLQCVDRAELTSLIAALLWAAGTELGLGLWSDSLSTIQIAEIIQRFDAIPDGVSNLDLWLEVQRLLRDRGALQTVFHWIPSHLDPALAEDAYEDWVIHWNDMVDQLAVHTNRNRPAEFWQQYESAVSVLDGWATRVRQLRHFFFLVAEKGDKVEVSDSPLHIESSSDEDELLWIPWEDALPLTWQVQCLHGRFKVPGIFLVSLVNWICAAERLDGVVQDVSEIAAAALLCRALFQLYTGALESGIISKECGTKLDHGVLLVGYGQSGGQAYWIIKNSWGFQWGEDGFGRLARGVGGEGECGILSQAAYPVLDKGKVVPGAFDPAPGTVAAVFLAVMACCCVTGFLCMNFCRRRAPRGRALLSFASPAPAAPAPTAPSRAVVNPWARQARPQRHRHRRRREPAAPATRRRAVCCRTSEAKLALALRCRFL
eukprot:s627_g44.t1